jgi:processive 1,2-diacylglycerol beta-glucosyltransferase
MILTIANGAGHTRAAQALAAAIRSTAGVSVLVVDVADYMTRITRFSHVTAYLWMLRYAPALWKQIDCYQRNQEHTSPEWYYRRGCRRLFDLAREVRPSALIATEVGCCEIATLIKRDLNLDVPLAAVLTEFVADRAWVKPEVNLYCVPTAEVC